MIRFTALILIISIASCKNGEKRRLKIIEKDGLIAKGYAVKDTIFDGTVQYYDRSNTLIREENFNNGRMDGPSTEYFVNGNPSSITNFSNDLKNGINAYYDSLGNCYYKDFYYYDLPVGSVIFYDRGKPKRYFFLNLQNETLVDIDYRNWNGVENILSNCINYVYNVQQKDSVKEVNLLLYLINPPRFSFDYSILKKRNKEDNFTTVLIPEKQSPFLNLILPELSSDEHYCVGLTVYDSLLSKKTVIYKDVW